MRKLYTLQAYLLAIALLSGCQRPATVGAPEPQLPGYPDNIPLRARGLNMPSGVATGSAPANAPAQTTQAASAKPASPEEWGKQLFNQHGCVSCHSNKQVAPPLEGLYGQAAHMLANGSAVKADEAYIRESIVNPTAKVAKGYPPIMPSFSHLPKEEVDALVAYIKSL
ncbi:MAG: c-type cytochrome [Fimbriimonadales bacterium]